MVRLARVHWEKHGRHHWTQTQRQPPQTKASACGPLKRMNEGFGQGSNIKLLSSLGQHCVVRTLARRTQGILQERGATDLGRSTLQQKAALARGGPVAWHTCRQTQRRAAQGQRADTGGMRIQGPGFAQRAVPPQNQGIRMRPSKANERGFRTGV